VPRYSGQIRKYWHSEEDVEASEILSEAGSSMLEKILAGKKVVYIGPTTNVVDVFTMPDDRMICPHFERLKLASNGCFYQCDWCYLKLTYRAAFPFITIRAEYDKIKERIRKRLNQSNAVTMFNSGELADSLSMEHLTGAAREFIPWFGDTDNGYLFMLTKSDNVDDILDLPHNSHTVIAWSMNNEAVSRKYEIGAPSFDRRLEAAYKVQQAGYPVRVRLDPIVPFPGWREAYSTTVEQIFSRITPDRITLGTLRFEEGFYKMRDTLFTTGPELPKFLEQMTPMFSPKTFPGSKRPKSGKYSFSEDERMEIFDFIIEEVKKRSDCLIALCKESASVWNRLALPLSRCSCVCQLDFADMTCSS
jgi:spore photoproduct lyase